jgi:ABC-type glycerol-3-phosphate transport system substrate-binding protein
MGYVTEPSDRDARRLSRRSLLRGMAGVSALAILTACGQQASQPAAKTEPAAAKPTEVAKPAESKPAEAAKPAAPAAAAPAAKSGGNVELRFAWWGSQDRHDRTIKAIQLFEQKNPGYKANLVT